MDRVFTSILLLLGFSAASGKYFYMQEKKNRLDAQRYCQRFHTDLAPVSNNGDMKQLLQFASDVNSYIWIGLERDSTDSNKWMWSGGGEVSKFFWAPGQPEDLPDQRYGLMYLNGWHNALPQLKKPFVCYSPTVVKEKKTWEEALEYCREHHQDLASVVSETEMLLIKKEVNKKETTDHVWIGLHFFPGHWLWVDRRKLDYEAWGQEGRPACPRVRLECVAIQMWGGTQSSRTDSTLVTNATVRKGVVHIDNRGVNITAHNGLNIYGLNNVDAGVNKPVWKAHDCEERLNFICY